MKQFAVIGLGRFGTAVAETLIDLGHEVILIDEKEENINKFSEYVSNAIIGNAMKKDVIKAAGIKDVDAVIIAISNFETSVYASLICKELGVKKIVTKAQNDTHAEILKSLGVTTPVVPEKEMGKKIAYKISSRNAVDIITLSNDYDIVEILIPEYWAGNTIAQLNVRKKYGINILGFTRGKDFIGNPSPSMDLKLGDKLLILGKTEEIADFEEQN